MFVARWQGCLAAAIAVCLSAGVAQAVNFSFTGTFSQDDNHINFNFSTPTGSITITTYGYAGGTNAAGTPIPAGGFDPVLSLFDANGGLTSLSPLVTFTDTTGCGPVPADPSTGSCFDEVLNLNSLTPGNPYTVVLTQSDNLPLGPTYGDGFLRDGLGTFTGGEFGCSNGQFCDANGANRTGNWAMDISGAAAAAAPEPAGVWIPASGLLGFLALKIRRLRRAGEERR